MPRSHLILALTVLLLTDISHAEGGATTICDIRSQGERYLGTIVRVKAVYLMSFDLGAMLFDKKCAKTGVVDLTAYTSDEPSIVVFRRDVKLDIFGPPKPMCYLIDVTGRIVSGKNVPVPLGADRNHAPLGIEFQRVWSYEPLDNERCIHI